MQRLVLSSWIPRAGALGMVGDSYSEGCGFESQHGMLEGHFSHIFVVNLAPFEKTKINGKEAGDGPLKHLKLCIKI